MGAATRVGGFTLSDRLATGPYGTAFQAATASRKDLRALLVSPQLLSDSCFLRELLDEKQLSVLTAFDHPAGIPTVGVAGSGDEIVVVTVAPRAQVSLQEWLAQPERQGRVHPSIAGAIVLAVAQAAAAAAERGLFHGAIHPRSILIDDRGQVRLGDFAVGRALATAVATDHGGQANWRGWGGLAPELTRGDRPGPAADVYAIGALLFSMLNGSPPPGALLATAAVTQVVQRAIDDRPGQRYPNARALVVALSAAFEEDRWVLADSAELRRLSGLSRASTGQDLDDATEDLLTSLSSAKPSREYPSVEAGPRRRSPSAMSSLLDGLSEEEDAVAKVDEPPLPTWVASTRADTTVDEHGQDEHGQDELNQDDTAAAAFDAVGALTDEHTTLDGVTLDAVTLDATTLDVGLKSRKPSAPSTPAVEEKLPGRPPKAAATALPQVPAPGFDPSQELAPQGSRLVGRFTWVWWLVAAAVAIGGVVLYQQRRSEFATAQRAADDRAKQAAQLTERLRAELADPGDIEITTQPAEAAVWMLLGRTPVVSPGVSAAKMHELRLELDGHTSVDTQVVHTHWSGAEGARVANVLVALQPGQSTAPAIPAKPAATDTALYPKGRGVLKVNSDPPGAQVWMLVGISNPSSKISGFEAGRTYEFKVTRDGFLPGYVRILDEEWRNGGDSSLPLAAAPKHAVMKKSIELPPNPAAAPRRK